MALLSTAKAADRLGLSVPMVHKHIRSGRLVAHKVGSSWVIDSEALKAFARSRKGAGRPFSARMARGMVDLIGQRFGAAGGQEWEALGPTERSRLRTHLERLVGADEPAALLRAWLPRRDSQSRWSIAGDNRVLREDPRVLVGGAAHPAMGMSGGARLDLHVSAESAHDLVNEYYLLAEPTGGIVLHVEPVARADQAACLVDLAQEGGPREDYRVRELLQ